ncbi:hypothetical protein [Acidisphaera sp. S103]|uniref:hypothetical protein n=1 Tax=Acidisphaera sp. S103 TaxID=1747223 RepID=UPI00131B80F7|nr:hypothetical protein [Acidisphaera sp. S103]
MTLADKLNELIFEGGWVVEVISDVLKAAFFGGLISIGNVLFYARRETVHLQRAKEYMELLNIKDFMTKSGENIIEPEYLERRIVQLKGTIAPRTGYHTGYGRRDKIYSNALSVFMCALMILIVMGLNKSYSGFVMLVMMAIGCWLNYKIGRRVSVSVDNLAIRRISQVLASFTTSSVFLTVFITIWYNLPNGN